METGPDKTRLPYNLTSCEYHSGLKFQHRAGADEGGHDANERDHQAPDDRREPHHAEGIVELHYGDLADDGAQPESKTRAQKGAQASLHKDHGEQESRRRAHGFKHGVLLQGFVREHVEHHSGNTESHEHSDRQHGSDVTNIF